MCVGPPRRGACGKRVTMKQRSLLTASQLTELHEFLGRRLDAIGIESQPEVVLRLLELSKNQDAQLRDYAGVIKTDHAISGRVLKLANSAMFAQRSAVSSLERGCTLLGIERLKAVSLGFHLSRAANTKDAASRDIARKVWPEITDIGGVPSFALPYTFTWWRATSSGLRHTSHSPLTGKPP